MKLIRLTFKLVYSFIRYHFWEFFLFFIGIVLSFLLLILFSGNKIAAQYESFRQINLKRMYSYCLKNGQSLSDIAAVITVYGGNDVKNIVFAATADVAEKDAPYSLTYTVKSWYYGNEIAKNYVYSGRYWTEDEEKNGENVCLCKNNIGISSHIISIDGIDYSVIGSAAMGDLVTQILIPFNTFNNARFTDITLYFLPNEGVSIERAESINSFILSSFEVLSYQEPEIRAEWFIFLDYLSEMAEPLIILVFAIVSYLFVYSYILKKRSLWFAIFRMNGGRSLFIAALIITELFFYSFSAFILSSLIGYFLSIALDVNSSLLAVRFISVNLFIFGFVFSVSLILVIPIIREIIKSSGLAIYGKAV